MHCQECNQPNPTYEDFCTKCGLALDGSGARVSRHSVEFIAEPKQTKNPLTAWAWTFSTLTIAMNYLLISSGKYHWYYSIGDLATLWFVISVITKSNSAGKILIVTSITGFALYNMAYIMGALERPSPLWWCISTGLSLLGLYYIWKVQKEYVNYLLSKKESDKPELSACYESQSELKK